MEILHKIKQLIHENKNSKGDSIQMSTSTIVLQSRYKKQGGTLIHITKKWASMIMQKESDYHGRWSKIVLTGKNNTQLSIISAYRVCNNNLETAGGNTIWMQKYTLLFEQGHKNPNPRQHILDDSPHKSDKPGERTQQESLKHTEKI